MLAACLGVSLMTAGSVRFPVVASSYVYSLLRSLARGSPSLALLLARLLARPHVCSLWLAGWLAGLLACASEGATRRQGSGQATCVLLQETNQHANKRVRASKQGEQSGYVSEQSLYHMPFRQEATRLSTQPNRSTKMNNPATRPTNQQTEIMQIPQSF